MDFISSQRRGGPPRMQGTDFPWAVPDERMCCPDRRGSWAMARGAGPHSFASLLFGHTSFPEVPRPKVDLVKHLVRLLAFLSLQERNGPAKCNRLALQPSIHLGVDRSEHGQGQGPADYHISVTAHEHHRFISQHL